jgi:auxin response factor
MFVLGLWKSAAEHTQAFSFSGLQRNQELHNSSPNSIFSTSLNVGFSAKNERSTVTNNHLYWPMRDTRADSYSANINKIPFKKKQEPATAGCRLFGIEISSATSRAVNVASVGQEQPAASADVEPDQLSQPSHANISDAPAATSERCPYETESRQGRSCTKVIMGHHLSILSFYAVDQNCPKLEHN